MSYHRTRILLAMMAAMAGSESSYSTSTEAGRCGHLLHMFVELVWDRSKRQVETTHTCRLGIVTTLEISVSSRH
jgi:hypothetical protein